MSTPQQEDIDRAALPPTARRDPKEARMLSIGAIGLLLGATPQEQAAGLAGVIIGLGTIAAERYYMRR